MRDLARRVWGSAWTLLVLTNLFWSGNIVIGRAVSGHVPPVALAYWRWTGAFLVALPFAWPYLKRDWRAMARRWPIMLFLAATGIASYNTMSYMGLQYTTALNALLMQSAMPLVILVWAFVIFRERPTLPQTAGVMLSLTGVAAIASHGSLDALLHLSLNRGDLWVLSAVAIYGIYTIFLRHRPAVHPLAFLVAAMGLGSLMMLPFYVAERASGATIEGGWPSYVAMAYTAVLPSFVAYLFFNRGVELIGSARAGHSVHLMPVLGTVLAVVFLGEQFHVFHAVGITLIACDILLASLRLSAIRARADAD